MLSSAPYYTRLFQAPQSSFFLFGLRGSGKSTWARQEFPNAHVVDLLDEELQHELLLDPGRFADELRTLSQDSWVIVDEIQRIPSLLNEVHRFLEQAGLHFLLLGSSAHKLKTAGTNLLAGRAVPQLVAQSDKRGGGRFCVCSYEQIGKGDLHAGPFDLAVCNFSLIGKETVEDLLTTLPSYLNEHGRVCIQTLHPVVVTGARPYQDGWRPGSWDGFGPEFTDPAPWYFRTVESWIRLLRRSGFDILECREPLHPTTGKPASIIFVGEKKVVHA